MPYRLSLDTSATVATRAGRLAFALSSAILLIAPPAIAQHPSPTGRTYKACYVPSTGTVYIVGEATTPAACGTTRKAPDVPVNLFDGGGALRAGANAALDGFAVTGTFGQGQLAATGGGSQLLWYPRKAAFRAGLGDSNWDDVHIGEYSAALGFRTAARGGAAVAMGWGAEANGDIALAFGLGAKADGRLSVALGSAVATGESAVAVGNFARAGESNAVAIGYDVLASGANSVAIGSRLQTDNRSGAFLIGDNSSGYVRAGAANEFTARFAGGYRLFSNAAFSAGVTLSPGGGAWESVSDVRKKTAFHAVDGEELLSKLAEMPMQTWQYKSQDASIRHMGPTAQDFRAAFGLGGSDTTITTIDADGVALAAAKALEGRTRALQREVAALRVANATLAAENAELRRRQQANDGAMAARVARLERALDATATSRSAGANDR